jgi:hypothetical protein
LMTQAPNYPQASLESKGEKKSHFSGSVLECGPEGAHPSASKERFWAPRNETVLENKPRAPAPLFLLPPPGLKGPLF